MDTFYALPEEYYYDSYYPIVLASPVATNNVELYYVSPDQTITIILSGPYQQVMRVKKFLDANPPSLLSYPVATPIASSQYPSLTPTISGDDQQVTVTDGGVTYSGSGVMIFAASSSSPHGWHVVLFCTNDYRLMHVECGACEGNFAKNEAINDNFLFEHAQKQCHEKSIGLFTIIRSNNAAPYVDITLSNQTIYRVFCYWITMPDIKQLPTMFLRNKFHTSNRDNFSNYGPQYRATVELSLFKIESLVRNLQDNSQALQNVQSFKAQDTSGTSGGDKSIHGRTLLVLRALLNDNKLGSYVYGVPKVVVPQRQSDLWSIIVTT